MGMVYALFAYAMIICNWWVNINAHKMSVLQSLSQPSVWLMAVSGILASITALKVNKFTMHLQYIYFMFLGLFQFFESPNKWSAGATCLLAIILYRLYVGKKFYIFYGGYLMVLLLITMIIESNYSFFGFYNIISHFVMYVTTFTSIVYIIDRLLLLYDSDARQTS